MELDNRSIRQASVITGVSLLLLAILGGLGNFGVLIQLVSPDDPTTTANDIRDSEGLFRVGIAILALVPLLDIIVAWGLMRVLEPVNEGLSRIAAWIRLAYAGVFLVAISRLTGVTMLLDDDNGLAAFDSDQLEAQALLAINAFNDTWNIGLGLFGFHLLLVGYLAWRSSYMPKWLGALVALAGFGYTADSISAILIDDYALTISAITFIGEVVLIGWLLLKGRTLTLQQDSVSQAQPTTTDDAVA